MDKNFDPYNFSAQNMQPGIMNPMMGNMQMMPEVDMMGGNPTMFYEQQYMYYKYMTQMIEYKMKMKEWDSLNSTSKSTTGKNPM